MTPIPSISATHVLLAAAHDHQELDSSITREMLPALAEHLQPIVTRYVDKEGTLPERKTLSVMVRNFNQDGPRVLALLKTHEHDKNGYWKDLRKQLERFAKRRFREVGSHYQEEIATRTWIRIHRYLPNYLFLAAFSTWNTTILNREYLRLRAKIEKEQQEASFEDPVGERGQTLGDYQPAPNPTPLATIERQQATEEFWQRLAQLGKELDLKILRLHMQGYTLEQIQQQLGGSPSLSTISRRLKRLKQRMREDEVIKEIAERLGIW